LEDYTGGTAKGAARSAIQEFNVLLIELGTTVLPAATASLRVFSEALQIIGGGHKTKEDKTFKPNWMENLHDWMPWSGPSALPKPQKQSFLQGPPPATLNSSRTFGSCSLASVQAPSSS
jgi:hypothetical protein